MHLRRMRVATLGALSFCLISAACSQAPPIRGTRPTASTPAAAPPASIKGEKSTPAAAPTPPPTSSQPLQVKRTNIGGIDFEGVAFDSRNHRLTVVDQPSGPGSRYPDAKAAAASRNGLAAINAGFFTPEGNPLGKVISAGTSAGAWNHSSLGSGVFMEDPFGRMALIRRAGSPPSGQRELLQAGPLLVENSSTVSRLDPTKPAIRSFIAWDGGTRWWIGRSSSCTLAELGAALRHGSPASWPVQMALNLDGGRSTNLWISDSVPGGPVNYRPLWNRPVRNFLILGRR